MSKSADSSRSAVSAGTNQVDLGAAMINGTNVFNAPYSNTRSVAELVIAEKSSCSAAFLKKRQSTSRRMAQNGKDSYEIRGKTLGIVGYGNIGSQVSVLAGRSHARGLHDAITRLPMGNVTQRKSLEELLNKVTL